MTRAKKSLQLSFTQTRMRHGKHESNSPSRFVREIDKRYVSNPMAAESDDSEVKSTAMGGWKQQYPSKFGNTYGRSSQPVVERRTVQSRQASTGAQQSRLQVAPKPVVRPQNLPQRVPDAEFVPTPILQLKAGQRIEHNRFGKELNVPLSFHEEDPALIGSFGVNQGAVSEAVGVPGAPAVAEDVLVARDCALALSTGAEIDIQHISSGTSVAIVRAFKALGNNIHAEATPQHFALTEAAVLERGTLARVNPPLRTEADRLAIIEGLKDNTIDYIATDHAPHSKEEKERDMKSAPSGMIGLETALALGITHLVAPGHLGLSHFLEKLTVNPAELYHLDAGYVAVGGLADLVIFDENETWTVTENFKSKASNSPFIGDTLTGKVKYTICSGKIVYTDGE